MLLENKYNLSLKENIFVAKKLLVQNIYNSAKLEGCNVTFPETQTILDGVSVGGLKISDVEVILNLRDAWKYLLATIEETLTLESMNKINKYVARNESYNWGVPRYGKVKILNSGYRPPVPRKGDIISSLNYIVNAGKSETEKAIELFLYSCHSQNYWSGNEKTGILLANKYLIMNGKGVLTIPENVLIEFNKLLADYYETGGWDEIKDFLYENAVHGMTINQEAKQEYSNGNEMNML